MKNYSTNEIIEALKGRLENHPIFDTINSAMKTLDNLEGLHIAHKIMESSRLFHLENFEEYKETIVHTLGKGYILPSISDASHYNTLWENSLDSDMDSAYYELLNSDPKYHPFLLDSIKELHKNALPGWGNTLGSIVNVLDVNNIESHYRAFMYPLYSYSEDLFITKFKTTPEVPIDNWDVQKVANCSSKVVEKQNNTEFSLNLIHIFLATRHYFFRNGFEKDDFVSRNSVLHGYKKPDEINIIEFYKLVHYLELLDSIDVNSIKKSPLPD